MPIVKKNFELVVIGIVVVSVIPVVVEYVLARRRAGRIAPGAVSSSLSS
jgi:hypothetical protein